MVLKRSETLWRLFWSLAALLLLSSCEQRALPPLPLEEAQWKTYTDEELGIRFQYPDALQAVDEGSAGMFLRYRGGVNVRVVWTDEETARGHGLWVSHEPVAEASLGGLPAQKFLYAHWDGPSFVRTESYVTSYRGKLLGLEFRPGGLPEEGRRRLLDSFQFLPEPAN
ncbi:MAG: hypothetical protein V3T83_02380 [Acidobacteriota bacterium]